MNTSLKQRVSLGYALYRVQKDFNIKDTHWLSDAKTWINDALQLIGYNQSVDLVYEDYEVANYKIVAPCNSELIEYILYQNFRLPKGTGKSIIQGGDSAHYLRHSKEYWIPAYPYIKFSFEEGDIRVFYWTLLKDKKDNMILIPNDPKYINALKFYVFAHLLLGGYTHPEFNYSLAMEHFEMWKHRAGNAYIMESPADAEIVGNLMQQQIFPTYLQEDLYIGGEEKGLTVRDF